MTDVLQRLQSSRLEQWPTVLSIPAKAVVNADNRCLAALQLVQLCEGITRFVTSLAISDLAALGELDISEETLRRPTFGGWIHVLRKLAQSTAKAPRFWTSLAQTVINVIDPVTSKRNRAFHHVCGLTMSLAEELLTDAQLVYLIESLDDPLSRGRLVYVAPNEPPRALQGSGGRKLESKTWASLHGSEAVTYPTVVWIHDKQYRVDLAPFVAFWALAESESGVSGLYSRVADNGRQLEYDLIPPDIELVRREDVLNLYLALFPGAKERYAEERSWLDRFREEADGLRGPDRIDLVRKLAEKLEQATSGIFWLYGPSGCGKSMVAAAIAKQLSDHGDAHQVIACRVESDNSGSRPLLAELEKELHLWLNQHRTPAGIREPGIGGNTRTRADRVRELVEEASRLFAGRAASDNNAEPEESVEPGDGRAVSKNRDVGRQRPRLTIVIDGIEHLGAEGPQLVLQMASDDAGRPRDGVVWLCSGQPERWFNQALGDGLVDALHANGLPPMTKRDVRGLLLEELGFKASEVFSHWESPDATGRLPASNAYVDALVERAAGSALYLVSAVRDIRRNEISLAEIDQLPPSWKAYKRQQFREAGLDQEAEVTPRAMCLLAVMLQPQCSATLAALLGDCDGDTVERCVRSTRFTRQDASGKWDFDHEDYRNEYFDDAERRSYTATGYGRLAERLITDWDELIVGQARDYILRHGLRQLLRPPPHCELPESLLRSRLELAMRCMVDVRYLAARCEAEENGDVYRIVEDLDDVLALTSDTDLFAAADARLRDVRHFFAVEGAFLSANPHCLLQQAHGQSRAMWLASDADALLARDSAPKRTWLRRLSRPSRSQSVLRRFIDAVPGESLAATPDAAFLVAGSELGLLQAWDARSGRLLREVQLDSRVTALAVTTDGKWVAAGTDLGSIYRWQPGSAEEPLAVRGAATKLNSIAVKASTGPIDTETEQRGAPGGLAKLVAEERIIEPDEEYTPIVIRSVDIGADGRSIVFTTGRFAARWSVDKPNDLALLVTSERHTRPRCVALGSQGAFVGCERALLFYRGTAREPTIRRSEDDVGESLSCGYDLKLAPCADGSGVFFGDARMVGYWNVNSDTVDRRASKAKRGILAVGINTRGNRAFRLCFGEITEHALPGLRCTARRRRGFGEIGPEAGVLCPDAELAAYQGVSGVFLFEVRGNGRLPEQAQGDNFLDKMTPMRSGSVLAKNCEHRWQVIDPKRVVRSDMMYRRLPGPSHVFLPSSEEAATYVDADSDALWVAGETGKVKRYAMPSRMARLSRWFLAMAALGVLLLALLSCAGESTSARLLTTLVYTAWGFFLVGCVGFFSSAQHMIARSGGRIPKGVEGEKPGKHWSSWLYFDRALAVGASASRDNDWSLGVFENRPGVKEWVEVLCAPSPGSRRDSHLVHAHPDLDRGRVTVFGDRSVTIFEGVRASEGTLPVLKIKHRQDLETGHVSQVWAAPDSSSFVLWCGGGKAPSFHSLKLVVAEPFRVVELGAAWGLHPSVQFLDEAQVLVADGMTIRCFDAADGTVLRVLQGHSGRINYLDIRTDLGLLLSSSDDHTVRLWDVSNWEPIAVYSMPGRGAASVIVDKGTILASTTACELIRLKIEWCRSNNKGS